MEGNHKIRLECDGVVLRIDGNDSDIDKMCLLFSDALLGLGYRFKEGWAIRYIPEDL